MARYKLPIIPTALYGLEPHIELQAEAAATMRGEHLTRQLASNGKSINLAVAFLHSHSPLFAGSDADPQSGLLFNDPEAC